MASTNSAVRHGWWFAFLSILIGTFLLVGIGYRHGLPYIDYGDEMTVWTMGRATFDSSWIPYQPQYPPGILIVSALVQQAQIATGGPSIDVGTTVALMRLTTLAATVIATGAIMLAARRLAGEAAGIVAGLTFGVFYWTNNLGKLSTNNLWVALWMALAVLFGVEACIRRSARWAFAALALALIGTLFKWQNAAAFAFPGLALFTLWNVSRRRMSMFIIFYLVIVGAFSYWAVVLYHALEGSVYYPGTPSYVPTPTLVLRNLWELVAVQAPFFLYGALPALALLLGLRKSERAIYTQRGLHLFPVAILLMLVILSVNGAPVFERHYMPGWVLLAILAGVGFALALRAVQLPVLRIGLTAATAVALLIAFFQSADYTRLALRPDTRTALAEWAAVALDGPTLFTDSGLATAVNPLYGYMGRRVETPLNPDGSAPITEAALNNTILQENLIRYLVTRRDFDPAALAGVTLLLRYAPPNNNGEPWSAWRIGDVLPLAAAPLAEFGGEVALRGVSFSPAALCPGDALTINTLWGPLRTPRLDYSAFYHLLAPDGSEIALPLDGPPARPTSQWIWPGEALPGVRKVWTVPLGSVPGAYTLLVGVYNPSSVTRLALADGADAFRAGILEIRDPTHCESAP